MDYWFSEVQTPNVKFSIKVDHQLYSGKSEFQRIDVFDSPEFGRFLALDGYMMLTEKDEFIYHEMIVHPAMAVHPNVKDVLVIGAGDGGVIREFESVHKLFGEGETYFTFDFHIILCSFSIFSLSSRSSKRVSCLARTPSS